MDNLISFIPNRHLVKIISEYIEYKSPINDEYLSMIWNLKYNDDFVITKTIHLYFDSGDFRDEEEDDIEYDIKYKNLKFCSRCDDGYFNSKKSKLCYSCYKLI